MDNTLEQVNQNIESATETLEQITTPGFWTTFSIQEFAMNILTGAVILVIGYIIIQNILKVFRRILQRSGATRSGIYYIETIIKFLAYFVLITITANSLGFQTGSLVALVASFGLAIALALRGSLTDLASGIMIVITRPIKVGDRVYLEGIDDFLEVKEIKLFNTLLLNRKNMIIVVPNERIMQNKVENLSKNDYVYTDIIVGVAYKSDIDNVKSIITKTLDKHEKVLSDHKYIIGIENLNQSSIELLVSAPVMPKDYFIMQLKLREVIFEALKENNISIPFPQTEVRILKEHEKNSIN